MAMCESCSNYTYDSDEDTWICNMDLDEDEVYRFYTSKECPYYRADDEYAVVRHQM